MDVSITRNSYLIGFTLLLLTACGSKKSNSGVFRENLSNECQAVKVSNQFVVKWKSGAVTIEAGTDREQFMEDFVEPQLDQIESVEFNHRMELSPQQDPLQPAPTTSQALYWGPLSVKASAAWKKEIRGQGVQIAVIDTGVDLTHEKLVHQIAWNEGESGLDAQGNDRRFNGLDDDGNGYIDDFAGYDFVNNSPYLKDTNGHGTHVSGILVAEHNDTEHSEEHVQGIAPQAKIIPVDFIDPQSGGTTGLAVQAIQYAARRGAKILNASWGGPICSQLLGETVAQLASQNILFVAAAGNQGRNIDLDTWAVFPAAYNHLSQITVGSVTPYGGMAEHSNYGQSRVHIFAPGLEIISTVPFAGGFEALSGTSMATPFVAGAAALLWSHRPQASYSQIKEALLHSVDPANYPQETYQNASHGRLNIERAIQQLETLLPEEPEKDLPVEDEEPIDEDSPEDVPATQRV